MDSRVLKKLIREKVAEGWRKFAIYPFGNNGLNAKVILCEYFDLPPVYIVDNEYADINPNIISIHQLKEKFDDSICVILTVEHNKRNMEMQNELLDFANVKNILNLQAIVQNTKLEKKFTLLEYISENFTKYKRRIDNLLINEYENAIKIYSEEEMEQIEQLCYEFVKEHLETECVNIADISDREHTILFFAPWFESFWSNMLPLMREFIRRKHKCVVMFDTINNFWWTKENIIRIEKVAKEIKEAGAECLLLDNSPAPEKKFEKCFFCSEYSTDRPDALLQYAEKLISVQTTGIYKHIYKNQVKIDQLYRELTCVDCYVGSDYICDWINRNNDAFQGKLLRMGYPKMDTLYEGLNGNEYVPEEWKCEIDGRKVILLTIEDPDIFIEVFRKYSDVCFIWRPDPEFLGTRSCNLKIEKLKSEIRHLVIDDHRNYVDSFRVSTAMIGMAIFCVSVNYIFTEKPLLLLDGKLNMYEGCITMNYQNEAWYNSGYVANDLKEMEDFINMVIEERSTLMQEQKVYRAQMMKNYDGKVCGRICDYFEAEVDF